MATYYTWKAVFTKFESVGLEIEELMKPSLPSMFFEILSQCLKTELEARGMTSACTPDQARDFMRSSLGETLRSSLGSFVKATSSRITDVEEFCVMWEGVLKQLIPEGVWKERPMKLPGMDWKADLQALQDDIQYWHSASKASEDLGFALCRNALKWQCGIPQYKTVFTKWKGNTLLHYAAWANAHQVVERLIENDDANVNALNAMNWYNHTPLSIAVACNAYETIMLLLEHGGNLNTREATDVPEAVGLRSMMKIA